VLGNWSSELGEIFHEVLSQKGLNVAGDPKDLFGQKRAVSSAEYLVGARITDIKGNFCHVHHWWDGRPLNTYSGEMFVSVEWTIFSSLLQREVLKSTTQGYFKQKQPKRDGIMLSFQNAFAHATENLMGSQELVNVALRKRKVASTEASEPLINIADKELHKRDVKSSLDKILPSVVTVRLGLGHGTGFVIAENGLVVTNSHVVGKSKKVSVILNNGLELEGEVLRLSERRDVALIKVPVRVPSALPIRLDKPDPLEKVFVIGTPIKEGLKSTVTAGIISALRSDDATGLDFIQSDAAISPGNSGGPLLDEGGNVIGISVLKVVGRASEGLNMFIPIKSALDALNIQKTSAGS
jgi:serine protease Do